MCPLCRVAHKADREYIWHFFDEGADQGESIDTVRNAFGVCAEHIEMLRRIDLDGMRSTLAISAMFADVFSGIVDDLASLAPDAPFRPARCPACANRDHQLRTNAGHLVDDLATSPGRRDTFRGSPGLCFAHFELAWEVAQGLEDRQLLLDVQRSAAQSLLHELREHVRKQDDKFRNESKGAERDSWLRAICLSRMASPGRVCRRARAPAVSQRLLIGRS
jgi:hypothetical protein